MSTLSDNLRNAVAYEVAKISVRHTLLLEADVVEEIAALVTAAVLEELASREEEMREAAPAEETSSSRDECTLRIMEYTEAAGDLRGKP